MKCPGCHEHRLALHQRLLVAARASTRCPGCGVTIRFGRLPRIIHTIFGDALLVTGAIGSFAWGAPILLLLSGGIWTVLALTLPVEPGTHDP